MAAKTYVTTRVAASTSAGWLQCLLPRWLGLALGCATL